MYCKPRTLLSFIGKEKSQLANPVCPNLLVIFQPPGSLRTGTHLSSLRVADPCLSVWHSPALNLKTASHLCEVQAPSPKLPSPLTCHTDPVMWGPLPWITLALLMVHCPHLLKSRAFRSLVRLPHTPERLPSTTHRHLLLPWSEHLLLLSNAPWLPSSKVIYACPGWWARTGSSSGVWSNGGALLNVFLWLAVNV